MAPDDLPLISNQPIVINEERGSDTQPLFDPPPSNSIDDSSGDGPPNHIHSGEHDPVSDCDSGDNGDSSDGGDMADSDDSYHDTLDEEDSLTSDFDDGDSDLSDCLLNPTNLELEINRIPCDHYEDCDEDDIIKTSAQRKRAQNRRLHRKRKLDEFRGRESRKHQLDQVINKFKDMVDVGNHLNELDMNKENPVNTLSTPSEDHVARKLGISNKKQIRGQSQWEKSAQPLSHPQKKAINERFTHEQLIAENQRKAINNRFMAISDRRHPNVQSNLWWGPGR